jgi:hypothetical protein
MIKILLQAPPHNLRNLKRNSVNQLHVLEQITQSSQEEKCCSSEIKPTFLSKTVAGISMNSSRQLSKLLKTWTKEVNN